MTQPMESIDGAADATLVPTRTLRARYGGISDTTVYRWLADPRVALPAPVYIGRMRYWRLSELLAWERERATPNAA